MASEAAPEAIITCHDLTVAYGSETVLHGVTLSIPKGAFLPFVGPNGAGKTTLLRTMLGFVQPAGGEVRTPFAHSPPGYVPQLKTIDPLFPVTMRQIVAMGLYPRLSWWRKRGPEDEASIDRAIERLGLTGHDWKRYSELSGGMKQKALIARALVSGADVFIMDEPTAELDEDSEREVIHHLAALSRIEGKTVLVALHGLEHATAHATQICMIDHGRAVIEPVGGNGHG